MSYNFKRVVIATGGTGGHIYPTYGLTKHFIENDVDVYVTSDNRGLKFLNKLKGAKIIKILSGTIYNNKFLKNIFSILIIFYSIIKSVFFLLKIKPNFVFGMGGYSSFPVCIAAKLLNFPIVIYENNLHLGKTNRYLLRTACKIFVPYKELEGVPEKYKDKVCEIGNIIRQEILNFGRKSDEINKNDELKILILGGSQAAKIFAEKLPEIFKECLSKNINLKIYQQCLPSQNNDLINFYQAINIEHEIFNFSDDISKYFSKVDLAITRSGSSMIAELVNVKLPFITIPLPSSADNHQLKNAIYYQKKGYSYLIEEKFLSEKMTPLINKIYFNRLLLDQILIKQKKHSDKLVYENIKKELKKIFYAKN